MFNLERRLEIPGWGLAGTIDTSHINKHMVSGWVGETGTEGGRTSTELSLLEENPGQTIPKCFTCAQGLNKQVDARQGEGAWVLLSERQPPPDQEAVSPSWEMGEGYPQI